jgi:hypothetical protein
VRLTRRSGWGCVLMAVVFASWPHSVHAQGPTMGGTLRYGSGLLDVPVSSVLPHLTIRGTYSAFWVGLASRTVVDEAGQEIAFEPGGRDYFKDGALAVGLYDHGEVGLSIQSLGGSGSGGNMWGLFGRARLLEPVDQGIGLAVGARYLTSPDFGDGIARAPGRLGIPDGRLRTRHVGADRTMRTQLTAYGVATAYLRGFEGMRVPANDMTFSLGWGGGMFRGSSTAELYGESSNGWFAGASSHWRLGPTSMLAFLVEHNGFDLNVGAQLDVSGARVGVHYLAANHPRPPGGYRSEYRVPKVGFLASIAVCPDARRFRCEPSLMERVEPDTIWIPPPPPDTVFVGQAATAPDDLPGEPSTVCLSTGQNAPIRITAQGDTLVGPSATPIEELRPVVDFAGGYAFGAGWFESGEDVYFEETSFRKTADAFSVGCEEILRVGMYQGVPVFADRAALRPLDVIFVPVRIGLWQRYERWFDREAYRLRPALPETSHPEKSDRESQP